MNVRIMYDPTPIRHIAVQCPNCEKWFYGRQIVSDDSNRLSYFYQLHSAQFHCPVCDHVFGSNAYEKGENVKIQEVDSVYEVYANCLTKKETWE